MTPLRTIKEAAALVNISPRTLENLVAQRRVPHTRIGRHVRFSDDHLAQIVAAGEQSVRRVPTRDELAARRTHPARTHPAPGPDNPAPPPGPKDGEAS